ncbi:glycosyltransferase family 2 protein [Yersinia similis]|uniref:WbyT n=1 Tax=Yersinia pseudotuberculosis TaxID=633 RepID=A0A141AY12_YERPU|nr:glycosyltransferase family 2 protein [Yersinia similis]AKA20998.1 WbyT [Yersinia pseudotuberculosis]CNC38740.1 glycosyl transferase family protein [Yersinia similis]
MTFTSSFSVNHSVSGGLRTRGIHKSSTENTPLISIVTVVFNGADLIENTIKSIISQSYSNVEFIVIDGGSSDGTLDILNRYDDAIDFWISEKDKGIYDAMNKGVKYCSDGSWIIILGSDDELLNISVVIDVIKAHSDCINIISDVIQHDIKTKVKRYYKCWIPNDRKYKDFLKFPLHHQGFFTKNKNIIHYFKPELGVHADLLFMYQSLARGKTVKINEPISMYNTGGTSDLYSFKNILSIFKVARELKINIFLCVIHAPFVFIKMLLKSIVSRKVVIWLRNLISRYAYVR